MRKIHPAALKCSNCNIHSLHNSNVSSNNNPSKIPSSKNNQSDVQFADVRVGAKVKKGKD